MQLVHTAADLAEQISAAKAQGKKVSLVATMGALHAGHLSLVELARTYSDFVVVSIFVNPKQFGANEDFDRYPRTLDADLAALATMEHPAELVFAPSVEQVYPPDIDVPEKSAGVIAQVYEGAARPGHFNGMLTVVARLFQLVQPDVAVFGEKDAQQLFLIRQMAASDFPHLRIIAGETKRESSGLAMSSRNRYLNPEQTDIAEILAITLATIPQLISGGRSITQSLAIGREMISGEPETRLEYLALVDPGTFEPVSENHSGPALLIVAATVGGVRLIDNHSFEI
ncbi:MAG: pantoate--beta-alanine ligase [Micrococcales bacterium]